MTYERPLKKKLKHNLCKLEIFRWSILPIGSTKKSQTIPRCNSALKQQLHKVAALDLPWLFNEKSNNTSALGIHKLEKTITIKTTITHKPFNENTIYLSHIVDWLFSYTLTNFQQLSSRKFLLI
jgi:hypothetical protein